MIILTAMILILLFIIFIAIALIYSRKKEDRKKEDIDKLIKKTAIWATVWLFVFIFILGIGSWYSASASFCSNCHFEKKYIKSWKRSTHKTTNCLACHQEPGVAGYLSEKLLMLKRIGIAVDAIQPRSPAAAMTSSSACLQCHENIVNSVVTSNGTRVAHKHIIEKGYRCTDCHNQMAHGKLIKPVRRPTMAECMECHNGKTAFDECNGCHVERIPLKKDLSRYAKVRPSNYNSCTGCHSTKNCGNCHKTQTPHPRSYFSDIRAHSSEASSVGKGECKVCHKGNNFCEQCHE